MTPVIYTASKTRHADKWLGLRAAGVKINATWIDEAGEGMTTDFSDLASRCVNEAKSASCVLLYCEPGDKLKGALIEVGAALAVGVPVFSVGFEDRSAFTHHPLWQSFPSIEAALRAAGCDR
jgi:hypothetical protein